VRTALWQKRPRDLDAWRRTFRRFGGVPMVEPVQPLIKASDMRTFEEISGASAADEIATITTLP
jgi:hypothetical protein